MAFSEIWLACLEQAWKAYCQGSVPVGAVWVDAEGHVRLRGRNRIHESLAEPPHLAGNRLAHAEMNVLVQVPPDDYFSMATGILYSTLEPCPLCMGAIVMSGVRQVYYGARDREAGASALLQATPYVARKQIQAIGPEPEIQSVSLVLLTDRLLRLDSPRTPAFIQAFQADDPLAVALAQVWYREDYLQRAARQQWPVQQVTDQNARAFPFLGRRPGGGQAGGGLLAAFRGFSFVPWAST